MQRESNEEHNHIAYFNPDVTSLEQAHQDFLSEMHLFHAGQGYENFNDFVCKEATEYRDTGDGVTYIVWNVKYDENGIEQKREMVSFYTLAATAIPYEDRVRRRDVMKEYIGNRYEWQFLIKLFPNKWVAITDCEYDGIDIVSGVLVDVINDADLEDYICNNKTDNVRLERTTDGFVGGCVHAEIREIS